MRSVAGNVIRGSLGNLIEWYDWYAYAAFSIYFASVFFPSGNQTAQLLNTAGIFAVGFLVRPLGGWLFGRYADRFGRRAALTLSVTLMGVGSLGIAVLPGYAQIGAPGTAAAGRRTAPAGAVVGRRVRNLGHLSERGRHPSSSRLLLLVPVRDADQRSTTRARRPDRPAAAAHPGTDARLGLADRVRHRSRRCGDRHVASANHGRVGELPLRRRGERRTRQPGGAALLSARVPDRSRSHPRRHHRVLHVHHLHAEVHDQHGRPAEGGGDVDQLRRVGRLRVHPARVRRALRSDRPPSVADRVRNRRDSCAPFRC